MLHRRRIHCDPYDPRHLDARICYRGSERREDHSILEMITHDLFECQLRTTRRALIGVTAIGLGVPALASLLAKDLLADDTVNGGWRLVRRLKVSDKPVFCVRFSPDGKILASASHDGSLAIYATNAASHKKPEQAATQNAGK